MVDKFLLGGDEHRFWRLPCDMGGIEKLTEGEIKPIELEIIYILRAYWEGDKNLIIFATNPWSAIFRNEGGPRKESGFLRPNFTQKVVSDSVGLGAEFFSLLAGISNLVTIRE